MAREISNNDDVIDSRDVIERLEELRDLAADAWRDASGSDGDLPDGMAVNLWLTEYDADEYDALVALAEEGERELSDWPHGETLIRESYFTDYAEQLAEDIGAIDRDASWPLSHIDWEAAADALRIDYSEITFDGVTYLARA